MIQVYDSNVAVAVERARTLKAHVITMSLGGIGFAPAMRNAIQEAIDDGIIVLAAAGNQVPFVVAPANYAEVIAVAASNIEDQPWTGSSRGDAVAVAAPGESVFVARAKRTLGGITYTEERGSGTSFAVALTAGVAALWLAHHGRDAIIDRYGPAGIQPVFARLLRDTARRPAGWDDDFGAGIVDADALLSEALPADVPPLAAAPISGTERLAAYFPDASTASARAALEAVLTDATAAECEAFAGEIAYHMSQRPEVHRAMVAAAAAGAPAAAADAVSERPADLLRSIGSPGLVAALG